MPTDIGLDPIILTRSIVIGYRTKGTRTKMRRTNTTETAKEPKEKTVEKPKAPDPYLLYLITGKWRGEIAGVAPARPTLPDHLARLLEDEEAKIRRAAAKAKPSQASPAPPTNGDAEEEVEAEVISQRKLWLEAALRDPALDDDAKEVITEALHECSPDEMLVRTAMRATTTFPKNNAGNFIVPINWFFGGLKAALTADGMYEDAAQRLVKRCVSFLPAGIDLGVKEPDRVHNANVTLGRVGPGEPQSSIKRFHIVTPRNSEFKILLKVLDSSAARPLTDNIERTVRIIGEAGLGGGRPQFGNFDVLNVKQIKPDELAAILPTLG